MLGRIICGWLCPMGLIQDLLYKIPTPKLAKSLWTKRLSYLKYLVFFVLVIAVPVYMFAVYGRGAHVICHQFCVVTLPAAVAGVTKSNFSLLNSTRVVLGVLVFGSAIFVYRSFCRFLLKRIRKAFLDASDTLELGLYCWFSASLGCTIFLWIL